ncbi:hypothetical protein HELRODRAFT_75529, partial [Helobdella robusta]|uniref:Uncharacterized protein n=1 Tax=Helobdella robusta TaxID=6412 RepID=T1G262_HELRO
KSSKDKPYMVALEIVSSEQSFINILKLLDEDFPNFIQSERACGRMTEGPADVRDIIRHLGSLRQFSEELLARLRDRVNSWYDPRIADVFEKTGHFLKLYSNYIRDFSAMTQDLDNARKKFPEFDKAVLEFESLPHCHKLPLKFFMLKPVQRIPQYKLLIQEYLKSLNPASPDYENAKKALPVVTSASEHANESIRNYENQSKMLAIQNSLASNDIIIEPGRKFIKEGQLMKLSRKDMQPRMFFLFNDILLYAIAHGYNSYKVRNVISLNGLTISYPEVDEFETEFNIIAVERSFTVAASSKQERAEWIEAFDRALFEYEGVINSQQNSSSIVGRSDVQFKVGEKAPVWVKDDRVSKCMVCGKGFSMTFRRHHCRGCGKVLCRHCSECVAPMKYKNYKPCRCCLECYDVLLEGRGYKTLLHHPTTTPHYNHTIQQPHDATLQPLPQVTADDTNSQMNGYLLQIRNKKWKRYWFVLKDFVLYAYEASRDTTALYSTPLLGYMVQRSALLPHTSVYCCCLPLCMSCSWW